ncbi:hypothetical protein EWM64_g10128, partial [Hericium alpestre]
MPSKSMAGEVKPVPPYPARRPVPDGLDGTMKFSFIPIRCEATGPGCPYEIPRGTREKKSKNEQSATEVTEYIYCCAIVYGPHEPVETYREPGDVWVNTGPNKSVWVVNGDGNCIRWPGNEGAGSVSHPWFASLHLWYGGEQMWNWWDNNKNLRSCRSRQRTADNAFGYWMREQGRTGNGTKAKLGNDVDAVTNWLEVLKSDGDPPEDGLVTRKRWNPPKRSKQEPESGGLSGQAMDTQEDGAHDPSLVKRKRSGPPDGGRNPKRSKEDLESGGPSVEAIDTQDDGASDPHTAKQKPYIPVYDPALFSGGTDSVPQSASTQHGLPLDCCVAGRDGKEWPRGSPEITWLNGLRTVLPYVKSPKTPFNFDAYAVMNMARSRFVPMEEGDNDAPVTVIKVRDNERGTFSGLTSSGSSDKEQARVLGAIDRALSIGKCAVISGWTPSGPRVEFDEAGLEALHFNLDANVEWQCARKRDAERSDRISPLSNADGPDNMDEDTSDGSEGGLLDFSGSSDEEEDDDAPIPGSRDIHRSAPLRSFIRLAKKPDECGNILDAPDIDGEVPWFIRALADDTAAWRASGNVGFSKQASKSLAAAFANKVAPGMQAKPPKGGQAQNATGRNAKDKSAATASIRSRPNGTETGGKTKDKNTRERPTKPKVKGASANAAAADVAALRSARARSALSKSVLKTKMGATADDLGPQAVNMDTHKLRNRKLVTAGGFYTSTHFDANGYATWVTIRTGAKLWVIRKFRKDRLERGKVRDIIKLYESMATGDEAIVGYEWSDGYALFLHEGITLVIPPGVIHEVYTPVNTIAIGGRFLTYNSIHLTQWCRFVDRSLHSSLTNAEHITIGRSVCRMVIALRKLRRTIQYRTFLALADMVISPQSYQSRYYRDESYTAHAWEDLEEWKEARRIVQAVLDAQAIISPEEEVHIA